MLPKRHLVYLRDFGLLFFFLRVLNKVACYLPVTTQSFYFTIQNTCSDCYFSFSFFFCWSVNYSERYITLPLWNKCRKWTRRTATRPGDLDDWRNQKKWDGRRPMWRRVYRRWIKPEHCAQGQWRRLKRTDRWISKSITRACSSRVAMKTTRTRPNCQSAAI